MWHGDDTDHTPVLFHRCLLFSDVVVALEPSDDDDDDDDDVNAFLVPIFSSLAPCLMLWFIACADSVDSNGACNWAQIRVAVEEDGENGVFAAVEPQWWHSSQLYHAVHAMTYGRRTTHWVTIRISVFPWVAGRPRRWRWHYRAAASCFAVTYFYSQIVHHFTISVTSLGAYIYLSCLLLLPSSVCVIAACYPAFSAQPGRLLMLMARTIRRHYLATAVARKLPNTYTLKGR